MESCPTCGRAYSPLLGLTPLDEEEGGVFGATAVCARHTHRRGEPQPDIRCLTDGGAPVACACLWCLHEDHMGHSLSVGPPSSSAGPAPHEAPPGGRSAASPLLWAPRGQASPGQQNVQESSTESSPSSPGEQILAAPAELEPVEVVACVGGQVLPFKRDDAGGWWLVVANARLVQWYSVSFGGRADAVRYARATAYDHPRIGEVTACHPDTPHELRPGESLVAPSGGQTHVIYRVSESSTPHIELALRLCFALTSDSRCAVRLESRCVPAGSPDGDAFPRSFFCQTSECERGGLPAAKLQTLPTQQQKKKYCCGKARDGAPVPHAVARAYELDASKGTAAPAPPRKRRLVSVQAFIVLLALGCTVPLFNAYRGSQRHPAAPAPAAVVPNPKAPALDGALPPAPASAKSNAAWAADERLRSSEGFAQTPEGAEPWHAVVARADAVAALPCDAAARAQYAAQLLASAGQHAAAGHEAYAALALYVFESLARAHAASCSAPLPAGLLGRAAELRGALRVSEEAALRAVAGVARADAFADEAVPRAGSKIARWCLPFYASRLGARRDAAGPLARVLARLARLELLRAGGGSLHEAASLGCNAHALVAAAGLLAREGSLAAVQASYRALQLTLPARYHAGLRDDRIALCETPLSPSSCAIELVG
eukprot:m51a1_g10494 hypothetical protein (660) ;mRNA; r:77038-79786